MKTPTTTPRETIRNSTSINTATSAHAECLGIITVSKLKLTTHENSPPYKQTAFACLSTTVPNCRYPPNILNGCRHFESSLTTTLTQLLPEHTSTLKENTYGKLTLLLFKAKRRRLKGEVAFFFRKNLSCNPDFWFQTVTLAIIIAVSLTTLAYLLHRKQKPQKPSPTTYSTPLQQQG